MIKNKIGIGGAQFGMNYGISNLAGKISYIDGKNILNAAYLNDICFLDSALGYGECETVLGRIGVQNWNVITKIPSIPVEIKNIREWMLKKIKESIEQLAIDQLYGVLLHDPQQLHTERAPEILGALADVRNCGLVDKIGVSVQHPTKDLPVVIDHIKPTLIQAPYNILDNSLVSSGWARFLRTTGCEVHTRSTFLQGLLLMGKSERPTWFKQWHNYFEIWDNWLEKEGISAPDACLRFVLSCEDIDLCIVGIDSLEQLSSLLQVEKIPLNSLPKWPSDKPIELITPYLWEH